MYHLCKATRLYTGQAYKGPSSDGIEMSFIHLDIAKEAAEILNLRNPVGWNLYDSETQELVVGHDFHKDML